MHAGTHVWVRVCACALARVRTRARVCVRVRVRVRVYVRSSLAHKVQKDAGLLDQANIFQI